MAADLLQRIPHQAIAGYYSRLVMGAFATELLRRP